MNIAGLTQLRTYVYTRYTAWGEESAPSPISNNIYLKEGQTVQLSGIPADFTALDTAANMRCQTAANAGDSSTGTMTIRIYRTVPSTQGTYYYLVGAVVLGTTTFTDSVNVGTLTTTLQSQYYTPPPATLQGIRTIHNGMMIGFSGNALYFAEPAQYHAWPAKYVITLPYNIVAVGNFGTSIIVATDHNPFLIQGSNPATMATLKMDYVLPCTSKRSMVNMGYGVCYASPGGLAIYSSQTGGTLVTKYVHDWDTWGAVNYANITATFYKDKYFATDGASTFQFERDDQVGGYLTTESQLFTATYYDAAHARLYYAYGGNLYLWDDPTQSYSTMDWKSMTMVTTDYKNYGAARVVADYSASASDIAIAAQNAALLLNNQTLMNTGRGGGGIGAAAANVIAIAANLEKSAAPTALTMSFMLYANKTLVFTTQLSNSNIFRLPTGYKTDTYEVRVTGNRPVRAIHLGETPASLREV